MHQTTVHHIKNDHANRRFERNALMARSVRALRSRLGVERGAELIVTLATANHVRRKYLLGEVRLISGQEKRGQLFSEFWSEGAKLEHHEERASDLEIVARITIAHASVR
jgi:hypothetical protein